MIRKNATGKFGDLLLATAKSPAMLIYLDNFDHVKAYWPMIGRSTAQVGDRIGGAICAHTILNGNANSLSRIPCINIIECIAGNGFGGAIDTG